MEFWKYNTDAELQGAFLVFSKEIFNYIDGFDSRTFLYYEEQLLYLHAKRSGLPMCMIQELVYIIRMDARRRNHEVDPERRCYSLITAI